MAKQTLTDFSLPTDAYASFDAVSLKALIKERLDKNSTFTDQNYEGSNLSSLIDIIAYSYHVLLFYLNQTSTESMFSEAELYENMNRIVKSLDYKPVGRQTSNLSFNAITGETLAQGTYTIPRYTFIDASGTILSLKEDITFSKTQTGAQVLSQLATDHLLYQGRFEEYPNVTARGEEFEAIVLVPGDDVIIDHFNIDVYIKNVDTGKWEEWTRTPSLYLEEPDSKAYEVRLNENKRYELKFGNGTTGKKLSNGDQLAIYYLKSDGKAGEIAAGGVDGGQLARLYTTQFTTIFNEVKDNNIDYISDTELSLVQLTNTNASSPYHEGETVDDIRSRAADTFSAQHRLVTKTDYETHVRQHFSNIIKDVKIANNWDHLDGHMKYLLDTIKLTSSSKDPNTLFNHVTFADSCDFNNIYIYAVPTLEKTVTSTIRSNYLGPAQKTAIINSIRNSKILTTETVIMDPVYMAVDIGVISSNESASEDITANTNLQLVREVNSARSFESIKNSAYTIFKNHLDNSKLGTTLETSNIVAELLSIDGVQAIKTTRADISLEVDGLSLLVWNPIYPHDDITITSANVPMPYFKYTYLNDPTNFLNKITVVSESTSTGLVEF